MSGLRVLPAAGVFVACLFGASAAHAAACPKVPATVDSGSVVDHWQDHPEGIALTGHKLRFPGHFYEATSKLALTVRGNAINVAAGTIFKLTCYGTSKGAPMWPAVDMLKGTVTFGTNKSHPAAAMTEEGLFGPHNRPDMQYKVSRTLTSKLSLTQDKKMQWFAGAMGQPTGTTRVESLVEGVVVNVTPYVGQGPGHCRYVKAARLTTVGRYGRGTATYTQTVTYRH
jgi:hypothetical protein